MSIKKTEAKYKTEKNGNLTTPNFPLYNNTEETREHYNYDCPQLTKYRKNIAAIIGKEDFSRDEWTLKVENIQLREIILVAKSRWILHRERCNIDHRKNKRLNHQIVLQKTKKQLQIVSTNFKEIQFETTEKKQTIIQIHK